MREVSRRTRLLMAEYTVPQLRLMAETYRAMRFGAYSGRIAEMDYCDERAMACDLAADLLEKSAQD